MSEEFEQLSRYRAGELSPDAARALEAQPGFADRLRQLQSLDSAVEALPVGMPDAKLEALMAKVRRPGPVKRRAGLELRVGLVAAGLIAGFLGWTFFGSQPEQWVVVPSGDVQVDGRAIATLTTQGSGRWVVAASAEASAQLVGQGAVLLIPGGAQVSHGKGLSVDRGTVLARADELTLRVAQAAVTVNGVSVLSMEPAAGVARVTELLNTTTSGELMKSQWMKLSTVAATAAALGGGLTLFVVDGHASVRQAEGVPVVVQAGEQWKSGEAKPTSFRGPAVAQAAAKSSSALAAEPTRSAELQALTPPQLIAMVETLRDEKEALLKQREALKKQIDGDERHPDRNYYRLAKEELLASAQKGELRLRGPQLSGEETKIEDKVRDDLAMTPEEVAKVKEIFEASVARTRAGLLAAYKEIGGDPNQASTLGSETIFNEVRAKSLKNDFAESVRSLADERAGLIPQGDPAAGPPIMRACRLFIVEDERVISELEKLLGPRRCEEFLNHAETSHSNHTFGVGPRKP